MMNIQSEIEPSQTVCSPKNVVKKIYESPQITCLEVDHIAGGVASTNEANGGLLLAS